MSQALFDIDGPGHYSIRDYIWENPQKFAEYFKFTFSRNSWDRAVSAYHYVTTSSRYRSDQRFGQWLESEFDDFADFVRRGLESEKVLSWVHFKPQYIKITDKHQNLVMDYIGRFENLEQDFGFVANKLGVERRLPKINSSKRKDYREYYSDETAEIIKNVYQKDIELLNYKFDPE